MKLRIILSGPDGELDRQEIAAVGNRVEISEAILMALKAWVLAPGNNIKIEEV